MGVAEQGKRFMVTVWSWPALEQEQEQEQERYDDLGQDDWQGFLAA
jgi:hypothetical protein